MVILDSYASRLRLSTRVLLLMTLASPMALGAKVNAGALVLVNSQAPDYADFPRLIELVGSSDLPTKLYVFESSDKDSEPREWEAPAFKGKAVVQWNTRVREKVK